MGALLYEMISGVPPHQGVTYQDILAQRALALPEPLRTAQPELPEELDRAILRALEPDPEHRFQTMAQLQYELTKIVWGRPRAVAELLNMREPNARLETPMGLRNRWADASTTVERKFEDFVADGDLGRKSTPASAPLPVVQPSLIDRPPSYTGTGAGEISARTYNDAAVSGAGSLAQLGVRTVGTLAILSLGVAVSLGVYHRFAWVRGADAGGAASSAPAAALGQNPGGSEAMRGPPATLQALQTEAERRAGNGLSPATVPVLLSVLQQMRERGAAPSADRIALSASSALKRRAEAALDQGNLQGGVDIYQVALALDPTAPGTSLLARALLDRGRQALAARRPAEAVRWGRKALSFAEADPGAHAFLADALFAEREFAAAGVEYAKALSSRPQDGNLRRGLARSRARVAGHSAEPRARPATPAHSTAITITAPMPAAADVDERRRHGARRFDARARSRESGAGRTAAARVRAPRAGRAARPRAPPLDRARGLSGGPDDSPAVATAASPARDHPRA